MQHHPERLTWASNAREDLSDEKKKKMALKMMNRCIHYECTDNGAAARPEFKRRPILN
jgi:hypothetical protein